LLSNYFRDLVGESGSVNDHMKSARQALLDSFLLHFLRQNNSGSKLTAADAGFVWNADRRYATMRYILDKSRILVSK